MSMETKNPVPPASGASPAERYERRDANIGALLKFALGLFVILVVVFVGMKWTFTHFAKSQQLGPPASPFENARVLPPSPRLQVDPQAELRTYCKAQEQDLLGSSNAGEPQGTVSIPIDRAMQKLLEKGLPVRAGAEAPAQPPPAPPNTSESGIELGPCGYLLKAGEAAEKPAAEPEKP